MLPKSDAGQKFFWTAIALLALAGLYLLGPILTPFLAGAILAYILNPGVEWLVRKRLPRSIAAVLVIVATIAIGTLLVLILVPLFTRQVSELSLRIPALLTRLNEQWAPLLQEWFGVALQFDAQSIKQFLSEHWQSAEGLLPRVLASLKLGGLAIAGLLGNLLLIPLVLFYLLLEWNELIARVDRFVPRRYSEAVRGIARDIDLVLAEFLRGQLSVMGILAVYYALALVIGGVDFALPIGIITGLLVFVPYLGFATGLGLALMVAVLQFENPLNGVAVVAVVFGLGQVLESFYLTPRIVGDRIGLHPLAVIFALLAFGQVFGFFGVLMALPASAVLLVALRRVNRLYFESGFYSRTK